MYINIKRDVIKYNQIKYNYKSNIIKFLNDKTNYMKLGLLYILSVFLKLQ